MNPVMIDVLHAVELAEVCEVLDQWLAASADAAVSYNQHIGTSDAHEDLRTALQHFAAVLNIAQPGPVT